MSKICAKCGIEKDNSEFRVDNKSKDKMGCWCKDCDRAYKMEYYARNRDKINAIRRKRYNTDPEYKKRQQIANKQARLRHLEKTHKQEKIYRDKLQLFIDDVLKGSCVKCGETKKWLIQFHHIDPNKKSFQIQATKSRENLLAESKKCVCLCVNCHTEYHYFFGKQPKNAIETLDEYLSKEFDSNEAYLRKRTGNDK